MTSIDVNNFVNIFFLHNKVSGLSLLKFSAHTFIDYPVHIHVEPTEEHREQLLIYSIAELTAKRYLYIRDLHIRLNLSYFDDVLPTPKTLQVDEIFHSTIFSYLRAFSL